MNNKGKIITWSIIGSILVLAAIFIPLTFFVFLKVTPLNTPSAPTIVVSESKIYISTTPVELAEYYTFEFTLNNKNVVESISESPTLTIDISNSQTQFQTPGIYSVSCKASGTKNGSESAYSESTTFTLNIKLETPAISISSTQLSWESVENANKYLIYIASTEETIKTIDYSATNPTSNIERILLADIISNQALSSGQYEVSIRAQNTSNIYFIESNQSKTVNFTAP